MTTAATARPRGTIWLHVMGGLGNQMFQYAAGRSLALRNGLDIGLDPWSGFVRDRMFRRAYRLAALPVIGRSAGPAARLPFWIERLKEKLRGAPERPIASRPWGLYVRELAQRFYAEVRDLRTSRSVWMHGHWQSELYFDEHADDVARELAPPAPNDERFLRTADLMESSDAVVVGVRLYEELGAFSKAGVGGVTDLAFYSSAAAAVAASLANPAFFVFSSASADVLRDVRLPGPVHFITPERGYEDPIHSLWLMTRARRHVIANSSLYWWGAWLAERQDASTRVVASDRFINPATVPDRWKSPSVAGPAR